MKNLWSDNDARATIEKCAANDINEDLALRVYTTRLLGSDPRLVQHGGGNTSVKTQVVDAAANKVEVLCVKGSGWDMGTIEPIGLPSVRLAPLLALSKLKSLSDEDMVNLQRTNLLDAAAPTPSVETLLHAFIPHKFIDHTHANAILSLIDRPDGVALARDIYGDRLPVVPYVMPGFELAKKAKEVFDANPECEGLVLHKHGIFSFGTTAREAYDRMITFVSMAEKRLRKAGVKRPTPAALPTKLASATDIAPILRGLVAIPLDQQEDNEGRWVRMVLDYRENREIIAYVNGRELQRYSQEGPVTPDHVIRTKPKPLILPAPEKGKLDAFTAAARKALQNYQASYRSYFDRHNAKAKPKKKSLDTMPRVILVPGVGLFGLSTTAKDACIVADVAETCVSTVLGAEAGGKFESINERSQFDMEYWSLEQAKLGQRVEKPLQGQIVVITGAAGTIGGATAAVFRQQGAEVALLDLDGEAARAAAERLGGLGLACDVTKRKSVDIAFEKIVLAFGGVDILVSNAGAAWQGRIGEVDDATLRKSFDLNFFAAQNVSQATVRIMLKQGTGGSLLFNVSKQAVNPGPSFGPYGIPKAALMALMRQYAIDYGRNGITANAVNADRIRSGLLTENMVQTRAKARGISHREYMAGNLLGREVRAKDVADAFISLALARKTTGAVLTVDGGNIAAAMR